MPQMLRIEATIKGADRLGESLDHLNGKLDEWEKPLQKIGTTVLRETTRRNILTSRGADGPFAALAESTKKQSKDRKGGPLYNEGGLLEAASADTSGVLGSAYDLKQDELTEGVDADLFPGAFALEYGFDFGNRHLEGREFLGMTERDENKAAKIADDYLGLKLAESF